jgi:hypothetical protein
MAVDPAELAPAEQVLHFEARPRSITAAARRIDPGSKEDLAWVPKKGEKWQDEAWAYVDAVPELKFASGFNGNALSRLRLYPAVDRRPGPAARRDPGRCRRGTWSPRNWPTRSTRRHGSESRTAGSPVSSLTFGTILSVSGDSWAVATPETPTEDEQWNVYSESAITKTTKGLALREAERASGGPFPEGSLSHPDLAAAQAVARSRGLEHARCAVRVGGAADLLASVPCGGKSRNNAGILFLSNKLDHSSAGNPATGSRPGR